MEPLPSVSTRTRRRRAATRRSRTPRRTDVLGEVLERALPLLAPEQRPAADEADVTHGYLDLLGPDGPPLDRRARRTSCSRRGLPGRLREALAPRLGQAAGGAGPSTRDEHRIARLLLGLTPGDGVLDVACGPGNFTREFARIVGEDGLAVGIDVSESMLAPRRRATRPRTTSPSSAATPSRAPVPRRTASTPSAASPRCTSSPIPAPRWTASPACSRPAAASRSSRAAAWAVAPRPHASTTSSAGLRACASSAATRSLDALQRTRLRRRQAEARRASRSSSAAACREHAHGTRDGLQRLVKTPAWRRQISVSAGLPSTA